MHMPVYTRLAICLLAALTAFTPSISLAQTAPPDNDLPIDVDLRFNPSDILKDEDIFGMNAMNYAELKRFLDTRGTLGRYRTTDIDGKEKPASEIIWRIANSYAINPQYLLALMQKEQSLVEDLHPTQKQFDWATGYGVCDACSMNDPRIQEYKGFASQLEWAAKQHREKYLGQLLSRGTTISGQGLGRQVLIDGAFITPANNATAMLYSYTPHLHGNLNLWRIWQRWFAPTFPDGTLVITWDTKMFYLLRYGQKRPFTSRAVAASMMNVDKAIIVDEQKISGYSLGAPIRFPNYAIVEVPDGKRYLINGNQKRLIASQQVFAKLGFNEDEVLLAEHDELDAYSDGRDITLATAYPTGILAKDDRGSYWYVEDGVRHLIPYPTLLNLYFNGRPAKTLPAKQFSSLVIGEAYKLNDGELVRSPENPSVYVIEHGLRRPIVSGQTFEGLGWQWKNVIVLPENVLASYPVGSVVTAENIPVSSEPHPALQSAATPSPHL